MTKLALCFLLMLGIKTTFLELVRCKMEKNTQKKNSHDTKFTWFTTRATSTELQQSFTIK